MLNAFLTAQSSVHSNSNIYIQSVHTGIKQLKTKQYFSFKFN